MSIKRIFIVMTAIFAVSAVFADNSSVTSKKYVDDLMSGYQGKLPGSGANTLMIYDDEDGIGEKAIATTLGNSASAVSVPTVGAVKTGLDGKQDTITGTAGYVMTGTGNAGEVGEKPIYSANTNYSDALVTAETVNTGVINAVNNSLRRVNENGDLDSNGTLWEINTSLFALGYLPDGYTKLEYIGTNHNAYIMTNFTVNDFDRVVADIKLYDNDTELNSKQFPHLFGVSADALSGSVQAKVFRFFNPTVSSMYAAYNNTWASSWGGTWAPQSVPLNTWHKFDIKLAAGEQYIKMDTSVIATGTMSSTLVNSYKLPIFAMNYAGDIKYIPHLDSKIIKMYLGNTLVANLVPAKNSSGIVGMYDTVSGQFFTSETSSEFTAGPSCISPNLINMIPANITVGKYISAQGVVSDSVNNFIYNKYIPVKPNTKYTLSFNNELYFVTMSEYSSESDAGFIKRTQGSNGGNTSLTITTGATTQYLRWGSNPYGNDNEITLEQIQAINWMLTEGDTAQTYRPYGENICD